MNAVGIGALEIQMLADLSRLRRDMNEAKGVVGGAMDNIRTTITRGMGAIGVGISTVAFVRWAKEATDAVTTLNNQLRLATGSTAAAKQAYDSLFTIAQRSRVSFTELGGTFATISRAVGELGISQQRLLTVTQAIGNSMAISGGSAQGMNAALIQLSQGFASGTLRGEELNSVMEQTPRLARAIADGMGVTIGKLREMGKEGKLTAEAIIGALESQAGVLSGEVEQSVTTLSQAMTMLGNAAVKLAGQMDQASGTTQTASGFFKAAANELTLLGEVMANTEKQGGGLVKQLANLGGAAIGRTLFSTLEGSAEALNWTINALTGNLFGLSEQIDLMPRVLRSAADQSAILGRELQAAEAEMAALQRRFEAGERNIYFRSQIGDLDRYIQRLKDAKAEQDKLMGGGAASPEDNLREAARIQGMAREKYLKDQAAAIAAFNKEFATSQEKASAAVDKWRQTLGLAFTPEMEKKIRDSVIKPTKEAASAFQDLAKEIGKTLDEQRARASAGGDLSKAQELELDLGQRLLDVQGKLTRSQRQQITTLIEMAVAGQRAADASDALKTAMEDQQKVREATLKAMDQTIAGQDRELQQLREQYIELTAGKEVLAEVVALRYEDAAAKAEQLAATMALAGEDEREIARQRRIAANLREMITLRKGIMSATATREAEQANARAADKAVDEWSDASQQIGQALADALMRGGQNAIEYIRGLVRTLVFQPVLTNVSNTAVNAAGNYIGMAANYGLTWATGSGGWSGAGGIAGYGASLANYGAVYSGAAYGTGFASQQSAMLAAQEAGMVSSAGGASAATISLWAAAIAAGVYRANQDWNNGFRRDQARDVSQTVWGGRGIFGDLQPMGGLEETKADFLSRLGFSDKIADLFSGATAVAALFGRSAPRITSTGLQGVFGGGDFTGSAYADILEKGGLFRRDKRYTETAALTADLERFLDGAAAGVADQAKAYGEALGLPVAALAGITRDIKIELTDDAEANKAAIMESLAGYGDALVAGWAEAVAPLAAYGETTVQTIQRVGAAILGVNSVLEQIGVTALAASIDGGKAAMALTEAFGGADNLVAVASGYFAAYFTEAEKSAKATEQITAALEGVGLALPESREAFRSMVEGLDLTTSAGREQFTVMMQVAGAFAELNPLAAELAGNLEGLTSALDELEDLVGGLEDIMGTAAKSIQDVLAAMIEGQQRLQAFRGALQSDILRYQLGAMNPQDRVAALRQREASLFGQLGTAEDPVAVAEQLTGVILDRVQEEAALRQQVDADHLDALREQLGSLERMQDLSARLAQFTAGLRSSDLSPLSYRDQLNAAGSLFDTTLARAQAGDLMAQQALQGNAQAYLQEARAFFGSSSDYADVFRRVTGGLDSVGGASVDPQIQAIREQVLQLEALGNSASLMADSSGEIAIALTAIDTALADREAQNNTRIDMQLELARAQITELQTVAQNQADTNAAVSAGNQALWDQLELLNTRIGRLLENAQLEAMAP